MIKSFIDDPPELEFKDLPSHLEYAFLEGTDKLPVIISKNLKDEEKDAFLKVLKSNKRAIAWKISDIKGIDPRFCTHKILMEDDFKPAVQHQRKHGEGGKRLQVEDRDAETQLMSDVFCGSSCQKYLTFISRVEEEEGGGGGGGW
ncbi:hypothetical protein Tco_0139045 [Tanacetum coccineum]